MSSKSNGYIVPIRTTKEEITKIKLLITSDISLLRKFILEFVPNLSAFKAKIPNGINIDKTKINKMMSPKGSVGLKILRSIPELIKIIINRVIS